jgi:NAD(P)-dependent dehydrogenase (short-subunit alcohol dehydrogenase family)
MSKVWFVTGSSRGLGRSFVEAALARGDRVAVTARKTAQVEELVTTYGDAALPLELDVTDKTAVFESVRKAKDHFGRLDVVVNNAGYGLAGAVEELGEQQLRDQLETNFFGPLWVVQAALPYLREQGSGHIIQVSSVAGLVGMSMIGGYAASKWALEGLSETLAQEVAGFGIKVTILEPGGYATEGAAGGDMATPNPLYDGHRDSLVEYVKSVELSDPAAAGRAILDLADADNPPARVFFGAQGYELIQQVYADRLKTWGDWQELALLAH